MTAPSGRASPGPDLARLIEGLDLDTAAKRYLAARWLDQVRWMEGRAVAAQRRHYALRLTAIVGGVAIPALVGWQGEGATAAIARGAAAVLGVVVAAATAVDGFLRPGDRWRHYRRAAEGLKAEFWRFAHRGGPYLQAPDLDAAFPAFVERVEEVLRGDVDEFFAAIRPRADAQAESPARPGPAIARPQAASQPGP